MKKIIGIVIASMMFANIGYAEMRLIEVEDRGNMTISTWCIDSYKFVVVRQYRESSSLVQFMRRNNNESVPVEC